MTDFLPIIVTAGLIAFVGTPFTLLVARRVGFMDQPSYRKAHLTPVPLLGGLAMYAGLLAGLIVFGQDRPIQELIGIAGGATMVTALGLWDDRFGMHPGVKIGGQVLAGAVLIIGGVQTRLFNSWLDIPLTLLWIVGICNAINFLDNMDGLAAGLAAVASGFFLLLAILNGQTLVAGLASAVLGACLGFLFYNFSPAITFMGDTGALMLGFMLAVLGIKLEFAGRPPLSTWMIPVVVLGVPIFDTTLVTLSRLRRGAAVTQGGTDHTSHRLARLGLSNRRTVVALWTVSGALGVVAVWMSRSSVTVSNLLLGAIVIAGAVGLWVLEDARKLPLPPRRPGLKPEMRVTVIAPGDALAQAIRAATEICRDVRVLLTPVGDAAEARGWRQVSPTSFSEAIVTLARRPDAVREFVLNGHSSLSDRRAPRLDLSARARSATHAFSLQGELVATCNPPDERLTAEALAAIHRTDLILLMEGDLADNLLPTLASPGLADELRRSKRPRVLVTRHVQATLDAIAEAAGEGIVTHLITDESATAASAWRTVYTVTDLDNPAQLGDALAQIWLSRGRIGLRGGGSTQRRKGPKAQSNS